MPAVVHWVSIEPRTGYGDAELRPASFRLARRSRVRSRQEQRTGAARCKSKASKSRRLLDSALQVRRRRRCLACGRGTRAWSRIFALGCDGAPAVVMTTIRESATFAAEELTDSQRRVAEGVSGHCANSSTRFSDTPVP